MQKGRLRWSATMIAIIVFMPFRILRSDVKKTESFVKKIARIVHFEAD